MTRTEHQDISTERLTRLMKYLEFTPDNHSLLIDAITLAIELGDINAADSLVAQALGYYPDSAETNAHAGTLHLHHLNYELAYQHLLKAVNQGMNAESVVYNLAYSQYQLHAFESALAQLSVLKNTTFLKKEVTLLSARCKHNSAQLESGIDELKEFLKTCDGDKDIEGLLAIMLCDNDQHDQAIFYANQSLKYDNNCFDGFLARGSAAVVSKNYHNAYADFRKALTLNPTSGRAWSGLAQVDFYNFQFDAALEGLKNATIHMTDHIGTWHLLGWTWLMKDNYLEALNAFKKSYELDRTFGETHGCLASAYALKGDLADADRHIKLAQKLSPNSFAYVYAKMVVLNKSNKKQEAAELFQKVKGNYSEALGTAPYTLINSRLEELSVKPLQN